ncbi:MAG: RNA-directed DNA polymerase [Aquamicrobium sp.]|nr:RNA-directed DNA polymerase [Aquamicrobium sp.]
MHSVDVSKCFSSIYTHSIAWALKDIRTAKDSTSAITFGNQFDILMQKMNFNETNGICIGPEVSRIFAEIILSRVDQDIEASLAQKQIFNKKEYEIRRYVDDFFIFTNDYKHVEAIGKQISLCLSRFNLHVNEGKIETIERPFYTTKSKIVDDASRDINSFFESMLEKKSVSGRELLEPKNIWKPSAVVRHFLNEIKSSCFDSNVGYDMVSSYVISAIEKRLDRIISDYDALGDDKPDVERYLSIFTVLLEIMFFFYTVHATVAASFTLSKAIIKSSDFLRRVAPERLPYLGEKAAAWTARLLQDPQIARIYEHHDAVPIEILNILIALREVDQTGALETEAIERIMPNIQSADYFSIISVLYYMGGHAKYDRIRRRIVKGALRRLETEDGCMKSSEMVHLALDIASCPHIPLIERAKFLGVVRSQFQLPALSAAALQSLSTEFENEPWFVRWTGVDLLALIVKKELSAVY